MSVELRGVIQFYDSGHRYVDLVVNDDTTVQAIKLRMGVDVKVNRGKILTFLAAKYGIPPGQIVWPEHILVEEGKI